MRPILSVLRHIIDSKLISKNSTLANVLSSYLDGGIHGVSGKQSVAAASANMRWSNVNVKGRHPQLYLVWPGCNGLTPSCCLVAVHSLGTFIVLGVEILQLLESRLRPKRTTEARAA